MKKQKTSLFDKTKQALVNKLYTPPQKHEELIEIIRQAHQDNIIDRHSLAIIENTLQLEHMKVRDVMIPQANVVLLSLTMDNETLLKTVIESGHSRFPVIGKNTDEMLGVLLAKDVLYHLVNNEEKNFNGKEYLRPSIVIPESKRLSALLTEFQQKKSHMAIVVDEYGNISGLITIEDVLEQIVGDIDDEHDTEQDNIITHKNNRFLIKAATTVDEFNTFFSSDISAPDVDTVAGFIIRKLGHLPKPMSEIDLAGFHFKVLKANSRRVHLLEVSRANN